MRFLRKLEIWGPRGTVKFLMASKNGSAGGSRKRTKPRRGFSLHGNSIKRYGEITSLNNAITVSHRH